jgi:hypothetical protein
MALLKQRLSSFTGKTPGYCISRISPTPEYPEAHRIAAELLKIHRDGTLLEKDRHFYATLIATFGGTYQGMAEKPVAVRHFTPTKEQRVRVPLGLTPVERQQFLQDDLDAAFGT